MKKNQMVYRYISQQALKNKKAHIILRQVAKELNISPNTVSLALMPLVRVGALTKYMGHFEVTNINKLLNFWAVYRNFDKDIVYSTYANLGFAEIERRMPEGIAYTCYSGYVALFGNDASDYDKVYVYATKSALNEIKRRFPQIALSKRSNYKNIVVLAADPILEKMIENHQLKKSAALITQIYVDLWNNKDWFAYEFLKKLKKRIDDIYAKAILL